MGNFNFKNSVENEVKNMSGQTTNLAGGLAFELSDKVKLYDMVSTWLVGEPKFYNDTDDENTTVNVDSTIFDLLKRVAENDPVFVLQLAVYARNTLYLRSAPQVLLGEVALTQKGKAKTPVKRATPKIIKRVDELMNVIAYVQSRIGHIGDHNTSGSLPAALKKGIANTFGNFNEYQFQKYNNLRRKTKLSDVIRLTHPSGEGDEQKELFRKIRHNELATPVTWETVISEKGSNTESWNEVLPKMPYMALLRNGRNVLEHDANVDLWCQKITNKEAVLKSRQFPFRFYSAYKVIQGLTGDFDKLKMLDAISTAMEYSVENIETIPGNTIIAADSSSSMGSVLGRSSTVHNYDVANVLFSISNKICEHSMGCLFDSTLTKLTINRKSDILQTVAELQKLYNGGATYGHLVLDWLTGEKIKADRLIMITDMQLYGRSSHWGEHDNLINSLTKYRRDINPKFKLYLIDVQGYGTTQVPENDKQTLLISGWNDKVLNYINTFEKDNTAALEEIEKIEI